MGSGQVGRYAFPSRADGKCKKGHDLVGIVSVKLFSIGRDWLVGGYLFCPVCKVIYRKVQSDGKRTN